MLLYGCNRIVDKILHQFIYAYIELIYQTLAYTVAHLSSATLGQIN